MVNQKKFAVMEKENLDRKRGSYQMLLSYQEETRTDFLFLPSLQQDAIHARCPYHHDKKLYKKGHPSLHLTDFLSHTQKCKNK